ncbi:hypothetical protein D3C86_1101510 [compost metagenome]
MGEEIFCNRAGDAPTHEIDAALAVGKQRGGIVEDSGVEVTQRIAQIAGNGVGEAVENVQAGRIGGPAVVFGDGSGDRCFQFLMQMRLKFRIALITEFLHHARHRWRRNAGIFRDRGDAAEAGDGVVAEQAFRQPFFRTGQRAVMGMDDIRHGRRRAAQIFPLSGLLPVHG